MNRFVFPATTGLFVLAMLASSLAYLAEAAPMVESVHVGLGYPMHFFGILGTAKLLGALALAAPGLPRLKEWAYAGFTFNLIGAVWAHLASGHGVAGAAPAAFMFVLMAASYATRPADRRLADDALPALATA